jgi:hypothetical protein
MWFALGGDASLVVGVVTVRVVTITLSLKLTVPSQPFISNSSVQSSLKNLGASMCILLRKKSDRYDSQEMRGLSNSH